VRLGVKYDGIAERIGAAANLVPIPIGLSMFGMPIARTLQVAQRTGMLTALASGRATASELAARLGLREQGTSLVLDVLAVSGILQLAGDGRYSMPSRAAKWLSPDSESYVGDFLADTYFYWEWWEVLEDLVRDGKSIELHDRSPDDPYWRSYITGQYQLARLSSGAVAKAVGLSDGARSLLDVAGAHGEFSMALCRRHDGLRATVVDLPGSARIGREIVAANGMSDRVQYVEGDMFEADLGGLDLYDRPAGQRPDSGSFLGLFFHLTSGADTYSTDEVSEWLAASGFGPAQRKTLPQLPGLALLRAERGG
jgi:hypothetical protein